MDSDPRVLRQIAFFEKQGFEIILSGLEYNGDKLFFPLVKSRPPFFRLLKLIILVTRLTRIRVLEFLRYSSLKDLSSQSPTIDLILANDAETWPLALELKKSHPPAKVIFDAHEQYAKEFSDMFVWKWFHKRFVNFVCENYIPKADRFITVCDGIAQDYAKEYGVEAHLILNTPDFKDDLMPSPEKEKIQIIHHGIANRSRKIEKMINLVDHLDIRFELKLMLVPSNSAYLRQLKEMAQGKKIEFLDPVPTQEISAFINRFDIGLFILEPVNFNYANALPNKFFEFIQARLAIAIGPSPEMKKIVEVEQNGIVTKSFEEKEMAQVLNKLSKEEIQRMKAKSHEVAWKYSNHQNENVMKNLLHDLNLLQISAADSAN
ncbi:glycosyltransferase family 4 protein [Algoriphagus terrigena]|uniref:glycosyltransferase family 4 protein n=1 Tax=Algoriphagus terrigena TaxID=344884 RepID=UPI0003FA3B9D|nr:glycosyltransferase family 4 protein [Algoriphagus terrigena]